MRFSVESLLHRGQGPRSKAFELNREGRAGGTLSEASNAIRPDKVNALYGRANQEKGLRSIEVACQTIFSDRGTTFAEQSEAFGRLASSLSDKEQLERLSLGGVRRYLQEGWGVRDIALWIDADEYSTDDQKKKALEMLNYSLDKSKI